ncbi:MAG: N-acetylmuramoyl-L-alanine amidase [Acidobacteriota bacterium]
MPSVRVALLVALSGCTAAPTVPRGPVATSLDTAAAEAGVPADLVTAIAVEEGGIELPALRMVDPDDSVPIAGALELRHGRLDTLALGARLLGTTEDALRADTTQGTRAGALVLAKLGAEHGATSELASWRGALEAMAGMDDLSAHDYASRVLAILRAGGAWEGAGGELIRLAPHPEIAASDTVEDTARIEAAAAPDYPGAIWFTTSCTNKCTVGRPLGNAAVNKIVIHDTEGGWDASVSTLQYDSGKSVHYIVDADGSRVGQFRPETDTTWHAGNYYYNETSIGIEHVGYASKTYKAALYETSVKLVKSIRSRWSVPLDRHHIVGHYQIPDGNVEAESSPPCMDPLDTCENSNTYGGAENHRDPGENWQWCEYMQQLGGSCTCNDAWSLWNCTTDGTEAWRCHNGTVESQVCNGAQGCTVMPVGQNDVCDTSGNTGSGSGSDPGSGSGSGSDPGTDPGMTDPGAGAHGGGCSTGGGAGLGVLLALGLVVRRRR